jgi:hypothetical protein
MQYTVTKGNRLQLDGNVVVVEQDTDSRQSADVSDKNAHGLDIVEVPRLKDHVDSAGENVGEQEEGKTVAVESVQDPAGSVGDAALLDRTALGAVQGREHEHLNATEDQELSKVESAHPADVRAVGHAARHKKVRAVVPQAPDGAHEPDSGPFEQVDDGQAREGGEVLHRLFGAPVLWLFLLVGDNFVDLLVLLGGAADDGGEPVSVLVHGVPGQAGGQDGVLWGLFVTLQDAFTSAHAGQEDGEVADERVDTLAVLRQEVPGDALGEDDVVLEGRGVEQDLVADSDGESNGAVGRDPAQNRLQESESRGEKGEGEEEVPVYSVLAFVLGVVKALDGGKTDQSEANERNGVAKSGLHAGANGFLDLREVLLELLTGGNNTSGEDERANTEVHEGCSEGFSLAKTTRENGEVDSQNAAAGDDHHGATVAGDERLDWERIPFLGLFILCLFGGVLVRLRESLFIVCTFSLGLQVCSNGGQKKKTSKGLRRVGIDSGGTQDSAALQEEVYEIGLNRVRLEEALPLLQDTPCEDGNLKSKLLNPCSNVVNSEERRAYRSHEGQDVDLPDATAL